MILLIVVFTMSASEPVLGPIYLIFLQDKFATNITHLAGAFLPAGLVTAFLASRLGALSDSHSRFKMMALGWPGPVWSRLPWPRRALSPCWPSFSPVPPCCARLHLHPHSIRVQKHVPP